MYDFFENGRFIASYDSKRGILKKGNEQIQVENTYPLLNFINYLVEKYSQSNRNICSIQDFRIENNIWQINGLTRIKQNAIAFFKNVGIDILDEKNSSQRRFIANQSYTIIKQTSLNNADDNSKISNNKYYHQDILDDLGQTIGMNSKYESFYENIITKTKNIFIYGDGGFGKTELLKRFYISSVEKRQQAYKVNLSYLLLYSISNPINNIHLCRDIVDNGGKLKDEIYTSYLFQLLKIEKFTKGCYFFFDGLNELLDQKSNETAFVIFQIVKEITQLCSNKHTFVIISSRNKSDSELIKNVDFTYITLSGINNPSMKNVAASYEPDEEKQKILYNLLTRPIFYNFYYNAYANNTANSTYAIKSSNSKLYDLLFNCYLRYYEQTAGTTKNIKDRSFYSFAYLFVLPYIAYIFEQSRQNEFYLSEFYDILDSVNRSDSDYRKFHIAYLNNIINCNSLGINVSSVDIDTNSLFSIIINTGFVKIITMGDEKFVSFEHQTIREFLCSMYVSEYLFFLKKESARCAKVFDIAPSFNLRSDVQELIKDITGINSKKTVTSQVEKAFVDAFIVPSKIIVTRNILKTIEKFRSSCFVFWVRFEMYDHFTLHFYDAYRQNIESFTDSVIEYFKGQNIEKSVDRNSRMFLIKALCGLIESLRRKGDFAKCHKIAEFVVNDLDLESFKGYPGEAYLTYASMKNQIGKFLIFESLSDNNKNDDSGFKEALSILEDNKEFPLSAALIGGWYSTPVVPILKKGFKRDVVKAFDIYYSAYKNATRGFIYLGGTELIYIARQSLSLLMKGYVSVKKQDNSIVFDEVKMPSLITKDTLDFANQIFLNMNGQNTSFMPWLRAVYDIYTKKISRGTYSDLIKEEENHMTIILRLSRIVNDNHFPSDKMIFDENGSLSNYGKYIEKKLWDTINFFLDSIGKTASVDDLEKFYLLYDAVWFVDLLECLSQDFSDIDTFQIKKIRDTIKQDQRYKNFQNNYY